MSDELETRSELWSWAVRGTGLGAGLLSVLVVALVAQAAANVIVMVIVALLLASALRPVMHGVRTRAPIPRVPIVLTVYVLLVTAVVTLVVLLVPTAMDQASDLATRLPELAENARSWLADLEPAIVGTTLSRLMETFDQTLMSSGLTSPDPGTIIEFGLDAADLAIAVLSVFTLAFFWLISREAIQRFVLAMLPFASRHETRLAWNGIEERLGYWVRGQLALMTVVGVLSTGAYLIFGLPNALLLGVFAGIVEIIPIVGPAIGVVPALITAFATGGIELFLLVIGAYVVIQGLEGQVLVPIVMKKAVGLPPFMVLVSLLIGGAVAGLVGALLAVPVATAVGAIMESNQARRASVAMDTPDLKEPNEPPSDDDEPDVDETSADEAHRPSGSATRDELADQAHP